MTAATIGIIGAGTMGSGIAIAFANANVRVVIFDADGTALERSRQTIAGNYAAQMARGRIDAAQVAQRTALIAFASDLCDVAASDLVIEAVYESLELKASLFARLSAIVASQTILATNTSSLDVDAIAKAATHTGRCVGMHFFSPAHVTKLVEVVRGECTSGATLASVCDLARAIGKTPVVVGNADGFVGNRMLLGYKREAEFLVLAGAEPREVDAALEAFGFSMGPFAVGDLAGIDVGVRAKRERAARGAAPAFELTALADRLVEAGRLGRKTGRGFYAYPPSAQRAPDDELAAIVADERERLRVEPRAVPADEIVERCVLALVNEGARLIESGIARSSEDIDVVWRLGYGFPAARGGPMAYGATLGYDRVLERIERYALEDPAFWTVAPLIRRWATKTDGKEA